MVCSFFGHKDTPIEVLTDLSLVLEDLILNRQVVLFYVGNQGGFDWIVRRALRDLKLKYSHIDYYVVLAYLKNKKLEDWEREDYETIYPEGLETVPLRFAIDRRNIWMVENSDYIVSYTYKAISRSAKYVQLAERKGKVVVNLAPQKK